MVFSAIHALENTRMGHRSSTALMQNLGRLFAAGTVSGVPEHQLLERFLRHRDGHAFEALVERYGPMVLGVCRRILRDPNDVEDAFQATFLVLVRKGHSIRDRQVLGPWLHAVASKTALRARSIARRQGRSFEDVTLWNPRDESAIEPSRNQIAAEYSGVLDEELGRLPEKYRAPIVLCYYEGLTHDEAAARLRWPVGTVRGRLARARDRLRDRLTRRGVTLASALAAVAMPVANSKARVVFVESVLVESTSRAALAFAAAPIFPIFSSSIPAVLLTQHVLRGLFMSKCMSVAPALALAGLITTGVVAARFQEPRATPAAIATAPSATPSPSADPVQQPAPAPAANAEPPNASPLPAPAVAGYPASIATTPLPGLAVTQSPALPANASPAQLSTTQPAAGFGLSAAAPGRTPLLSPSPANYDNLVEKHRAELDAAIENLTRRQLALKQELAAVSRQLERLTQVRKAFDTANETGARTDEPNAVTDLTVLREVPLRETSLPYTVTVDRVPLKEAVALPDANLPTTQPGPAMEALPSAHIETTSSRPASNVDDIEIKLNKLVDAMADLQKQVQAMKAEAPRSEAK